MKENQLKIVDIGTELSLLECQGFFPFKFEIVSLFLKKLGISMNTLPNGIKLFEITYLFVFPNIYSFNSIIC